MEGPRYDREERYCLGNLPLFMNHSKAGRRQWIRLFMVTALCLLVAPA